MVKFGFEGAVAKDVSKYEANGRYMSFGMFDATKLQYRGAHNMLNREQDSPKGEVMQWAGYMQGWIFLEEANR